jgi:hypothetical protein
VTRWCRTKKKDASRWRARSATRAAAGSLELIRRRRRYLLLRRAPPPLPFLSGDVARAGSQPSGSPLAGRASSTTRAAGRALSSAAR